MSINISGISFGGVTILELLQHHLLSA